MQRTPHVHILDTGEGDWGAHANRAAAGRAARKAITEFNSFTDIPITTNELTIVSSEEWCDHDGETCYYDRNNALLAAMRIPPPLGPRLPQPARARLPDRRQARRPLEARLLHVHRPGNGAMALHRTPGITAHLALRHRSGPIRSSVPAPTAATGKRAASSAPAAASAPSAAPSSRTTGTSPTTAWVARTGSHAASCSWPTGHQKPSAPPRSPHSWR